MVSDFRMEDLSGLDEALRVRHIANSSLVTCKDGEDPEEVFGSAGDKDFDQLPIMRANKIIAIAERSNPKARRPLDDSVLVSADSPLSNFIHTVHKQPYRLVVDGTAITGIVTWSDL
jgi:predicted transcriptional regulator